MFKQDCTHATVTLDSRSNDGGRWQRRRYLYYKTLLHSLKIRAAVLYSSTLSATSSLAQSVQLFILYFIEHYMQLLGGKKYWAFLHGIYFIFTIHPMYDYYWTSQDWLTIITEALCGYHFYTFTINVERFSGLNIHSFSSMKFLVGILSQCLGQQCLLFNYS